LLKFSAQLLGGSMQEINLVGFVELDVDAVAEVDDLNG
jgi:hypothetical protein